MRCYTDQDCALLRELTRPHMDLLLSKKKDAETRLMKQAVWEAVFTKYSETENSYKTALDNLKRKWDYLLQEDTDPAKNLKVMPKRKRQLNTKRVRQNAKRVRQNAKRVRQKNAKTKAKPNHVGDLNPQVQVPRLTVNVEKPAVTRSSASQTHQSKHATPIVSDLHAVENVVSRNKEISVIENDTQRPVDKEKALMRKLLWTQIRYHRRQMEIMEVEHQLKRQIMEMKKKKLNSDSNADSNRCLQISITK